VVLLAGATALEGVLGIKGGISRLRGRWHPWQGRWVMPVFHPSYLLRNPAAKRDVWEDMKLLMARMGVER
jgi:DNA polymerase